MIRKCLRKIFGLPFGWKYHKKYKSDRIFLRGGKDVFKGSFYITPDWIEFNLEATFDFNSQQSNPIKKKKFIISLNNVKFGEYAGYKGLRIKKKLTEADYQRYKIFKKKQKVYIL